MDGLDSNIVDKIKASVEDQSVSTLNFEATLTRIKQLKDKEKE